MLAEDRVNVVNRIIEYEKKGLFSENVEADPVTKQLLPKKANYLCDGFIPKLLNKLANRLAIRYYEKEIKRGSFNIKQVYGLENYRSVKGGAIITCNHFSVYDNYVVYRAISKDLGKRNLYKVIREGNYTNFKGLYGFFFRHCDTLPLSSNTETMIKFLKSVKILLARGEKILIYPEQSMWWNYEKPRPMKSGAFKIAAKNRVPVIPTFITMEDSEKILADGSFAKTYTLWILPAIYPKLELNEKDNAEFLKNENYRLWKNLYEEVYGRELKYGD